MEEQHCPYPALSRPARPHNLEPPPRRRKAKKVIAGWFTKKVQLVFGDGKGADYRKDEPITPTPENCSSELMTAEEFARAVGIQILVHHDEEEEEAEAAEEVVDGAVFPWRVSRRASFAPSSLSGNTEYPESLATSTISSVSYSTTRSFKRGRKYSASVLDMNVFVPPDDRLAVPAHEHSNPSSSSSSSSTPADPIPIGIPSAASTTSLPSLTSSTSSPPIPSTMSTAPHAIRRLSTASRFSEPSLHSLDRHLSRTTASTTTSSLPRSTSSPPPPPTSTVLPTLGTSPKIVEVTSRGRFTLTREQSDHFTARTTTQHHHHHHHRRTGSGTSRFTVVREDGSSSDGASVGGSLERKRTVVVVKGGQGPVVEKGSGGDAVEGTKNGTMVTIRSVDSGVAL
ncbi:hypothetical protein HK104_002529 [Borealophlyctis nickersoniae]|nr:hypothetical protein HK104_002529 [Borealophlyctis nickersoniae]